MNVTYKQIEPFSVKQFSQLMKLFGEVFNDERYNDKKPSEQYVQKFLKDNHHIVLIAQNGEEVIGGLVAYELEKFETEISELYI